MILSDMVDSVRLVTDEARSIECPGILCFNRFFLCIPYRSDDIEVDSVIDEYWSSLSVSKNVVVSSSLLISDVASS